MPKIRRSTSRKTTSSKTKKRDYKKEYKQFHGKPKQIKRRAQRNSSRTKLVKEGRVKKGDKKDVHHKDGNTANQSPGNLRVRKRSTNRADNRKTKKKKSK